MPGRSEDFLSGPFEQSVVDRDRERGAPREESGDDQIGQDQSERITGPAGVGEQSMRAAVMPHLIQPGAGQHPTHRSTAGLRDQTDNQADEVGNVGAVKHGRNTARSPASEHGAAGPGRIDRSLSQGR
jgi:hypothetical protein